MAHNKYYIDFGLSSLVVFFMNSSVKPASLKWFDANSFTYKPYVFINSIIYTTHEYAH